MREAGHDCIGMFLGEIDKGVYQHLQVEGQKVKLLSGIKPDIGRNLIIARSGGMKLLSRRADEFGQPVLDIGMDVLELRFPIEGAGAHLLGDLIETTLDLTVFIRADDPCPSEHSGMNLGAGDIMQGDALVLVEALMEILKILGRRFLEER
jgi:hypothetical protein